MKAVNMTTCERFLHPSFWVSQKLASLLQHGKVCSLVNIQAAPPCLALFTLDLARARLMTDVTNLILVQI